jgi:hypothetical protein
MTKILIPNYRLYLDESGDHRYENLEDVSYRYLTLLGCIFDRGEEYLRMSRLMEGIKKEFWPSADPDNPIVFHRADMVRRYGPYRILNDPNVRKQFDDRLMDLLTLPNYTIISVTIDKRGHKEKYVHAEHPYHYLLRVMLERYALFLQDVSSVGDVMAESRHTEDTPLKRVYRHIWTDGTAFRHAGLFQERLTSREIKIDAKSQNIAGLQLADLLAHPFKERILSVKRIRDNFAGRFAEKVYDGVQSKIRKNPTKGNTDGFGEIFI